MTKKNVVGGLALVSLGAAAAVATSHVQLHWGPTAQAAPVVAAEVKPALPPPSKEQISDARMLSRTFAQVASQLSPSVVRISITKGGGKAHDARQRAATRSRARRSSASSATKAMAATRAADRSRRASARAWSSTRRATS